MHRFFLANAQILLSIVVFIFLLDVVWLCQGSHEMGRLAVLPLALDPESAFLEYRVSFWRTRMVIMQLVFCVGPSFNHALRVLLSWTMTLFWLGRFRGHCLRSVLRQGMNVFIHTFLVQYQVTYLNMFGQLEGPDKWSSFIIIIIIMTSRMWHVRPMTKPQALNVSMSKT